VQIRIETTDMRSPLTNGLLRHTANCGGSRHTQLVRIGGCARSSQQISISTLRQYRSKSCPAAFLDRGSGKCPRNASIIASRSVEFVRVPMFECFVRPSGSVMRPDAT
jgi:hypothetical protein